MRVVKYQLSNGEVTTSWEVSKTDRNAKIFFEDVNDHVIDEELKQKRLEKLGYC